MNSAIEKPLCTWQFYTTLGTWSQQNNCPDGAPQQGFPTGFSTNSVAIPNWAHQPLTSTDDFDVTTAIESAKSQSVVVRIVIPIVVAVAVAILAGILFFFYRRRVNRLSRSKTLPPLPGRRRFWQETQRRPRWFFSLFDSPRSTRLRAARKNSDWEIDDDVHWLDTQYSSTAGVFSPDGKLGEHDLDVAHTSSHIRDHSQSSLLPRINLPIVHTPSFLERFIKFKGGIRKSPSYKAAHVLSSMPSSRFKIDGSDAPTRSSTVIVSPVAPAGPSDQSSSAIPAAQLPEPNESSVLLISRDGQDFSLRDFATEVPENDVAESPSALHDQHPYPAIVSVPPSPGSQMLLYPDAVRAAARPEALTLGHAHLTAAHVLS
ncbi:hypothetical protein A0H81_09437 [Grifola frondosa]|uniref:Uncharacterized protein n=1 Tax=Grifola frondosa TaxID=5627 RepID=A0A1C7M1K2_GRIFR|nr:hypothetical protein A0H81_09437 [Grifola frondosa]